MTCSHNRGTIGVTMHPEGAEEGSRSMLSDWETHLWPVFYIWGHVETENDLLQRVATKAWHCLKQSCIQSCMPNHENVVVHSFGPKMKLSKISCEKKLNKKLILFYVRGLFKPLNY